MAEDLSIVGPVFEMPQAPTRKASEYLTAHQGWVYSAVDRSAKEVSQINLKLYKKTFKRNRGVMEIDIQEVVEHEALSLLHSVNDFMTFGQFLYATQTYLELTGEAPWAILRGAGDVPTQLWPLRPDWLTVVPSKDEYISHYEYSPGGTIKSVRIERDDLIFLKYLNPLNPYRGKGAVQAASMAIDIDDFSDQWNRTFFFNAALPYIFFHTDKRIGEKEMTRLSAMWRSKFEGRRNAHKVAFLGKGLKPTVVGGSMKDLDFIPGKKYTRDQILASFHTSKANLGMVDDVNRANMEESEKRYMKSVVKPRMVSLVQYLNEFYLRNWPNDHSTHFFDFEDPTPEDTEKKIKVYDSGLTHGWLTINEVREEENRPPVEGGDVVYLPFNLQPVGGENERIGDKIKGLFGRSKDNMSGVITLKAKKKTEQQKLKDSLTMPIPPRRLREIRMEKLEKGIKHDLLKLVTHLMSLQEEEVGKLKTKAQVKKSITQDAKEALWKAMIAKTDVFEASMVERLQKLWEEQEKDVIRNLENTLKSLRTQRKKAYKGVENEIVFNIKDENKKWLGILQGFIKVIVVDKAQESFEFLGMPRDPDMTTATAVRFMQEEGVKFITSANDTTHRQLRATLAEGIKEGEGVPQLRKRVQGIYNDAGTKRAANIARTEVLRATNFGTAEAYRQSEIVEAKEWLTALDERVCPWCNAMDTKVAELNKSFFAQGDKFVVDGKELKFEYSDVDHPPLHPGCRCTLIPVIK